MTGRRHEPLSDERRAELLADPGVIHRRRASETPTRYVPELRVEGYINTLELLGRVDNDETNKRAEPPRVWLFKCTKQILL